jgi:hypothetical protein
MIHLDRTAQFLQINFCNYNIFQGRLYRGKIKIIALSGRKPGELVGVTAYLLLAAERIGAVVIVPHQVLRFFCPGIPHERSRTGSGGYQGGRTHSVGLNLLASGGLHAAGKQKNKAEKGQDLER